MRVFKFHRLNATKSLIFSPLIAAQCHLAFVSDVMPLSGSRGRSGAVDKGYLLVHGTSILYPGRKQYYFPGGWSVSISKGQAVPRLFREALIWDHWTRVVIVNTPPPPPRHNFAPPSLPPSFLTQILPQVEQEARGSPAELIEEGAQAEDQQGGHAETVVPEGEAQKGQQGDPALPAAQARRGAPQRGPMGPGIRAAAGMLLLLLLLLLHRRLRRRAQPARARKRSPIRLPIRGGEPCRPAAHGQGRAEGSPGGGRGGNQ